jgi:hypothetical protein
MTRALLTALAALFTIVLLALNANGAGPALQPGGGTAPVGVTEAAAGCDRYAAPYGSDRRAGTRERPFRSVPRLTRSLQRGETGCLMPGRYRHHDPAQLRRPGTRLVGIDGRARVDGAIWIAERATAAEIRGLDLTATDRVYFIPVKVQADRARVAGNRIRGSRSTTCVLIGSTRRARGVRIEQNWIHHCGRRGKLDHLIYVQNAFGTKIRRNVLSDNRGGWGVHLYPDADGSLVEDNLIDGNQGGVIFGGERSRTSDGNVVRSNVITFSTPRWNVEGSWDGSIGSGNVAYGNCLYSGGPDAPSGVGPEIGFSEGSNVTELPYAVRNGDDLRFSADSSCGGLVEPLPQAFPASTR